MRYLGVNDEERLKNDKGDRVNSDPGPCILCGPGVGIKDQLSQQGGDDNYVTPTPTPESASVWDVFDEGAPDAGNESGEPDMGEGKSLPPAEPELEPTIKHVEPETEPAILDSDIIWLDDLYARAAMIVKPISGSSMRRVSARG